MNKFMKGLFWIIEVSFLVITVLVYVTATTLYIDIFVGDTWFAYVLLGMMFLSCFYFPSRLIKEALK